MDLSKFTAVDETGKIYLPQITETDEGLKLTFKKEDFSDAKKLWLLPEISKANAGEEGFYLAPRNCNMEGDLLIEFKDIPDYSLTYPAAIMACYCLKTPKITALVRIERAYKFQTHIEVKDGVYFLSYLFDFTNIIYEPAYSDINVEIIYFSPDATLGDMARKEREIRLNRNELIALKEKCDKRPAVEYARKYPLIRVRMGWKDAPSPVVHQTYENEPEMFVACDFKRVRDIAKSLKDKNVKGAELQLVGWNKSGHDGRFPDTFPVEEKLGGIKELKKTIKYVKSLGYRISLHTNSIDAYEIARGFNWNDMVMDLKGGITRRGYFSGGYAYHICPKKQLAISKPTLKKVKKLGVNGLHYTDVLSIVNPDSCHSGKHPCATKEGIELFKEQMEYTGKLLGGFSSEGCMDFSLKHIDFGLYVCFGNVGKYDIPMLKSYYPFFELTYHGTVLYNAKNPTMNCSVKSPDKKLQLIARGGKPAFYFYSQYRQNANSMCWNEKEDLTTDTDEALEFSTEAIASFAEEYLAIADLQLCFMKEYEIFDNGLHIAEYENGTRIICNFSDKEITFEENTVPALDYLVIR